jgi:teichuronic acid biosynthesis glycosyltransferase TuaC
LACALWLKERGTPLIITVHGSDVHSMPRGVRRVLPVVLRRADKIICVSRALQDKLITLGADPGRLQVLPNGFSADLFDPDRFEPRDSRKLAFLGRLGDIKRVDLLLRALARCPADIHLEIAGEGPERPALESLVDSLHLRHRVTFLGMLPRERIPGFLSSAALLCIVSLNEGWPTVIFESFACGTPILATEVGGLPEALEPPGLGALVQRGVSPDRLASAIEEALAKPWDGQAIRQHALKYSWSEITTGLVGIYQQLMSASSPKTYVGD